MAVKLQIGKTYKVRDSLYCKSNGFITHDKIIGVDKTNERDFIGQSGEGYYFNGSIYGIYQKWEMDLVEEIPDQPIEIVDNTAYNNCQEINVSMNGKYPDEVTFDVVLKNMFK